MAPNKKKSSSLFQSVASRLSRLFGRENPHDQAPDQTDETNVTPQPATSDSAATTPAAPPSADPSETKAPDAAAQQPSQDTTQADSTEPTPTQANASQQRPAKEKTYRPKLGNLEPEQIRELIENYVNSQLGNTQLTVEIMAAALKTSRTGLYQLIHEYYGMTPLNYILQMRLQKAVDLLDREMSVRDVSMHCGFSDPKYFSKVFRKYKGELPSAYLANVKSRARFEQSKANIEESQTTEPQNQ